MRAWIPENEIRFAVRSGFLTKKLWLKFFSGKHDESWKRKRWRRLLSAGYFLRHPSALETDVLVPNPASPMVQNAQPGFRSRAPYLAMLKHEEILFEGLLILERLGLVRDFVTEYELKAAEAKGFTSPSNEKFADLILTTFSNQRLAIELELTQKTRRRYWQVLNGYRERRDVDSLLFVVAGRPAAKPIVSAAGEISFESANIPIGFLSVESWRTEPATKQMRFGSQLTTLAEFCKHWPGTGT